jgi:hypothetical protein
MIMATQINGQKVSFIEGRRQLRGSPLNVVVCNCSNALHSCSNAPMLSTAPADLQRSLEFQSSILVVDLENEVRV